jgi:hypothetical protein
LEDQSGPASLYGIAKAFRREMKFDFVQWCEIEDDGKGYIIADREGRALGGFVVRWRKYTDVPHHWALVWIWIAPDYRRQGWLRRTWEMVEGKYSGIIPEKPFSAGTEAFFASQPAYLTRLATLKEQAAAYEAQL